MNPGRISTARGSRGAPLRFFNNLPGYCPGTRGAIDASESVKVAGPLLLPWKSVFLLLKCLCFTAVYNISCYDTLPGPSPLMLG